MNTYKDAVFSAHALKEMHRRGIDKQAVQEVLNACDSSHYVRANRIVLHKILFAETLGKPLLYRIFIDIDCHPPVIVAAYRTSKIEKYGS